VLEPRGPQLGLITQLQGSKARLLLGFDAKEQVLPQRLLERLSPLPPGHEPVRSLGALPWSITPQVLAAEQPSRRALSAAWLLLLEAPEAMGLVAFTDLLCGDQRPQQLAACWLSLVGPQPWFRLRQGQVSPRPLEDLRSLRRDRRRHRLQEERDQRWLALLKARQPLSQAALAVEHQQRLEQLQQLAAGSLAEGDLEVGLRASLTALHLGTETGIDRGQLRHLLVDLQQWDPHQLASLAGSPWSSGFSDDLQREAERLVALSAGPRPGDTERVDLTAQRCVTIDDDGTRDIDDGLALEATPGGGWRLWIHVADPSRLVDPESPLDLEARRRGSSLYLARGILPMFPECLSTGPLSLRAGVRCAAWSTWVELDEQGAINACGLERSWVQPTYRLSYADADDLIDLAPPQEADLVTLEPLLQRRRRWRLAQGALQFDLPDGRIRSTDGVPNLEITEPGPARAMVAEAMILAGSAAAQLASEHGVALPFRSQLPAELPPKAELEALEDGAVRFAAIKRCLSRGLMGTSPAPHFSLGLPAYVQATSPIRRYGDLLVQRQLGAWRRGEQPLDAEALQPLLEQVDAAVREGMAISREDNRHWQQVWFEAHRHGQWRAQFLRWLRPQDRLGLVRVDELAMDLAAECPPRLEPGTWLLLRVHQVDPLRDQLHLMASAS
jgi:exoribonuclease-2